MTDIYPRFTIDTTDIQDARTEINAWVEEVATNTNIAVTSANTATAAATTAVTARDVVLAAETTTLSARDAAIAAGAAAGTYATKAEALVAVSEGGYFWTAEDAPTGYLQLYRDVAGVATAQADILLPLAGVVDAEISSRKAVVEAGAADQNIVLFVDSFGMGLGYIDVSTGDYSVGDVQIGSMGIVTPQWAVTNDGNDADQTIYMVDEFGMGIGILGGDDDDDDGGGAGPVDPSVLVAQPAPTYKLLRKLRAGQAATILACSDSTGAGTDRWIYKIADAIHAWDASVRVEYRSWNDTSKTYNSASVVYAGSGGATCTIYNAAVPGKQLFYQHGVHFEAAYGQASADWIIVNHGHNHDYNWSIDAHAATLIGGVQMLAMRHPYALVSVVAQNPLYDSADGTNRSMGAHQAATAMGWHLIDIFGMYQAAGKPAGWYDGDGSDVIHPSVAADGGDDAIYTNLIVPLISDQVAQYSHHSPTLTDRAPNLLTNGDFSTWTTPGSAPDGWTTSSTVSQETTIYETAGQSAKLTMVGSGSGLSQIITGDVVRALRGRYVTCAVRAWIPAATTAGVPGANISTSSDGSTYSGSVRGWSITSGNGRDGWLWLTKSVLVPANATHLRVDTPGFGVAAGQALIFDRVTLVPGILPKDMEF